MATATKLITADEFLTMSFDVPCELVRGEIVEMDLPCDTHGKVCIRTGYILLRYLEDNDIGQGFGNDTGVIIEKDPDTVRGPDICFVSYERLPREEGTADHHLKSIPELVFEVLSPTDRRSKVLAKVSEYLDAGVKVVCLINPGNKTIHNFFSKDYTEESDVILEVADTLELPTILPNFRVKVADFFK